MDLYDTLVLVHLAAGTLALVTYWGAAAARKGGPLHRRIGQGYLLAMVVVLLTAVAMSVAFVQRGLHGIAVFLVYLVVITGTACWQAWRAVRNKRDRGAFYGRNYRILAWLNLLSGVATLAAGVALGNTLLMVFCWIGIVAGLLGLRELRQPVRANDLRWWMREHVQANLGNGVATHIAFFSIGLDRLLAPLGIQAPQLFPWLAPVVVAVAAGIWLDRKYKFGKPKAAQVIPAPPVIPAQAGIQLLRDGSPPSRG